MNNIYNMDYELKIVYCKNCELDFNGKEVGNINYYIEMYDAIDCINSTIDGFCSFEEMKKYINEENVFDCLDNDSIVAKFENIDEVEEGEEINIFKFSKVLFNGKLIKR